MTSNVYAALLQDFSDIYRHLVDIGASLNGKQTTTGTKHYYCQRLLVKVVDSCDSILRLAPDPMQLGDSRIWDPSSFAALIRGLIDAHDIYVYLTQPEASGEDDQFRVAMFKLHGLDTRLKLLRHMGSAHPDIAKMEVERATLISRVTRSPAAKDNSSPSVMGKLQGGKPKVLISPWDPAKFCSTFDIDLGYYNFIYDKLSQHVHSYPAIFPELFEFKPRTPSGLNMFCEMLQFGLPFLARIAIASSGFYGDFQPAPTRDMNFKLHEYRHQVIAGVKWCEVTK